ncbi:MAG: flagellar basal body rod protein FlgB [Acidimicrobiia bacterium]
MPIVGDDPLMGALSKALSGLSARQRAIAQNLANIETPNYRARTVSFEDSLRGALRSSDPADLRQVQLSYDRSTDPVNQIGNNVQIEKETTGLEETSLRYQMLSDAVSSRFRLLRTVMKRDV